jgi:hypothetical protein
MYFAISKNFAAKIQNIFRIFAANKIFFHRKVSNILLICPFSLRCPPLAPNGGAAWHQQRHFCTTFQIRTSSAVAPNRSLCAGIFVVLFLFYT